MTMWKSAWAGVVAGFALTALAATGCDTHRDGQEGEAVHAGHIHDHDGHAHAHDDDGADAAPDGPGPDGRLQRHQWCFEHDVPEAVCTKCNPGLVRQFKDQGDWCAGHGLPESHCVLCNPDVETKLAALRPQSPATGAAAAPPGIVIDRWRSSLRAPNDPTCDVESNQIRLLDRTIAAHAGIAVEPATTRRISATIECPAEVRYDPTRLAHITPKAAGVVTEVSANLGDIVKAGDVLAVIDSATLGEAKSAYIEARESLLIAQADLDRHHAIHKAIQAMLAACRIETTSDELRRQYADARIGHAKSRLLTAHSQVSLARQRYDREKALAEKGISTQEALEATRGELDRAEAEFAATHEAIDIEMEIEHLASERAVRVARVALDAARRRLEIAGVSAEQIGALGNDSGEALGRYELRSPIGGTIVSRHAVAGESVTTDSPVFSVADLSRMWLMVSLEERDLAASQTGAPVLFTVDGLPGRAFRGALDWISSEVDARTRTVGGRVTLDNRDGLLRANMFGSARVIVRDEDEVLTVPEGAVQSDGCCNLVFVRQSDTLYRPRRVGLGLARDGRVEVLEGLATGEHVVTAGSFLMKTEILKGSIGAGCCEVDPGR